MGILDFITKQFIDVIDWTESESGVLAYQYPMQDREIQNGAMLTVRDSQLALFVNEGQIADAFNPGLHALSTRTLPILTNLKNWDKAFASPFKSDVYFFSTREQIDQKWGTPNALTIRDREFGPLRVQAHGIYSYKVSDIKIFYQKVSGSVPVYKTEQLSGQLRGAIIACLGGILGNGQIAFVDMAANLEKFSESLKSGLVTEFQKYGLSLESFKVQSLTLPEELQKRLDERAGISLVGNLNAYAQFQTAASIPTAAANPGGIAGAGAGLAAGIAMGNTIAQSMGAGAAQRGTSAEAEDPLKTIEKLHALQKSGVISQQEFEAKKTELLKKV